MSDLKHKTVAELKAEKLTTEQYINNLKNLIKKIIIIMYVR